MAIQPIDLQALFTQVDKVGKTQAMQRDGLQIQEALQQVQSQRKLEENIQSVNQTQNLGEETEKIKDDKGRGAHAGSGGGKGQTQEEDSGPEENKPEMIRDPALGRNIDISG